MSTDVPAHAGTRIPRPTGTTDTAPSTAPPTGPTTDAPVGPSGPRSALLVLVSVVLSVAASLSVVALTGADAGTPAPAAVSGLEQGDGPAEPGTVEQDAGRALQNYGYTRDGAFCPTSSFPPAAC